MAGTFNFRIEQGTTYERVFRLRDSDGDPVDITGWGIRMDVRETRSKSATLVIELTENNGNIQITDAANGEFVVALDSQETAGLEPTKSAYDIELFDTSTSPATVIRLLQGTFTVSAEVTG